MTRVTFSRRAVLSLCATTLVARGGLVRAADDLRQSAEAERALLRGITFLLDQQGQDGGWHSTTYGQLRGGPAVTALVLYALSQVPPVILKPYLEVAKKGYAFFAPGLRKKGTLAAADGSLDYPTYACALWLSGRRAIKLPAPEAEHEVVVDYLLAAQLTEGRGFEASSPSYGGWDLLGAGDARGITTGTNISLAAFALEALGNLPQPNPRIKQALKHGRTWVERCHQHDGGFAFTPEPASLNNKAEYADKDRREPRSYGTATCDGILALTACGVTTKDERIRKAIQWLTERPSLEVVPGFEQLPLEAGWQRSLRFYYYAGLARCLKHLGLTDSLRRRRTLLEMLIRQQVRDGSWVNDSTRMREDDPLIATSLAVVALGNLLSEG